MQYSATPGFYERARVTNGMLSIQHVIFILLLSVCFPVYSQLTFYEFEGEKLRGKVRFYKELEFDAERDINNQVVKGKKHRSPGYDVMIYYDREGKKTSEGTFMDDGSQYWRRENIYNTDSLLIEERWFDSSNQIESIGFHIYSPSRLLLIDSVAYPMKKNDPEEYIDEEDLRNPPKTIYQYNAQGKLIRKTETDPDDADLEHILYIYPGTPVPLDSIKPGYHSSIVRMDENGNELSVSVYNIDGKYQGYGKWLTDPRGNILESRSYNENNQLEELYIMSYDKNHELIKMLRFNKDSVLIQQTVFEYYPNRMKKRKELEFYKVDRTLDAKYVTTYTEAGKEKTMDIFTTDPQVRVRKTDWAYDQYHNLLEKNEYDEKGMLIRQDRFEYTYDIHGNWVTKIIYKNNKPMSYQERIIEYY